MMKSVLIPIISGFTPVIGIVGLFWLNDRLKADAREARAQRHYDRFQMNLHGKFDTCARCGAPRAFHTRSNDLRNLTGCRRFKEQK